MKICFMSFLIGALSLTFPNHSLSDSRLQFSVANDFTYQLQDYFSALSQIRDSAFDVAIIDYSSNGAEDGEWLMNDIQDAKTNGSCKDKIILAYMSIGEAEDYRFYWNPEWVDGSGNPIPGTAPDWLGPTNPDWAGNYKVRYWMPEWQLTLFGVSSGNSMSYLDRIIDAGFDGVYLDIIDAFEFWGPFEIGGSNERRCAAQDMIELVESISRYARIVKMKTAFLVVPQNGAAIIAPDAYPDAWDPESEATMFRNRYFQAIDGIGAEDVFFRGGNDENNPYDPDAYILGWLREFRDGGKKILSVEYLTQPDLVESYYTEYANSEGFVPYATSRSLDIMTINEGFEPECELNFCSDLFVKICMPSTNFTNGSPCYCDIEICSPDARNNLVLFCILEFLGAYYFAPGFSMEMTFLNPQIQAGINIFPELGAFFWPDTSGHPLHATWYGALTDASISHIEGEMDIFDFSWE